MPEFSEVSISRLLAILAWVSRRGEATIDDLAQHFDRSVKGIRTDIELIGDTYHDQESPWNMIEIDWDRYYNEDVLVVPNDRTVATVLDFTDDETISLIVALRILETLLPPDMADDVADTALQLVSGLDLRDVDLTGFSVVESYRERRIRAMVESARRGNDALELTYLARNGDQTTRVVMPKSIELIDRHWVMAALCANSGTVKNFRLDRVIDLIPIDSPTAVVEQARENQAREVTVTVGAEAAWKVENQECQTRANGTIKAQYRVFDDEWMVNQLLLIGDDLIECSDEDLLRAASRRATNALKNYAVE
ncbi:MAG: WYL domain-containing protein [Actinomycetaceae bacterium]|nr:WYL domain-containing protein [Actinomycetaceae bacterium]